MKLTDFGLSKVYCLFIVCIYTLDTFNKYLRVLCCIYICDVIFAMYAVDCVCAKQSQHLLRHSRISCPRDHSSPPKDCDSQRGRRGVPHGD